MKKRVIALFLILTVLFSLTSCDVSNLKNLFNESEGSEGEEENEQDGEIRDPLMPECRHPTKLEFDKTAFESGEEIKAKISIMDFLNYGNHKYYEYYDVFAINKYGTDEHLIHHGDFSSAPDSYSSANDGSSTNEAWPNYKHSEYITIPEKFFNKESGVLFVCISIPELIKRNVNPQEDGAQIGYDNGVCEAKCYHYISYERRNGTVHITSSFEERDHSSVPQSNTDSLVKHALLNSLSPDSGYIKLKECGCGYDIDAIELDFYFGRHFYGTAEQYRATVANIGKASIYIENDNGKQMLLAETSENYISEKYKTVWERNPRGSLSTFEYCYANYNENSAERITIPAEFIEGERGILFLSVYGRDMNIEGSEEERILNIPIQYTVEDDRVYLSRKFLMHRDESSNLDFFLDEIVTEEEALAADENTDSVDYDFVNHEDGKRVNGILIKDEAIKLYGLDINSTAEEFRAVFEELGYTVEEVIDKREFDDGTNKNGWCFMAHRNGVKIYLSHSYIAIDVNGFVYLDSSIIYICSGGNYDLVDDPLYSSFSE